MKSKATQVKKKAAELKPVSLTLTHIGLGVGMETRPIAFRAVKPLGFTPEHESRNGIILKGSTPQCCKIEFVDTGSSGFTRWRPDGKNIMLGCQNPDKLLPLLCELGFTKHESGVLKHGVLKDSPGIIIVETAENTQWHIGVYIEGRMCGVCEMRAKFPNLASHLAKILTRHKNARSGCYSSDPLLGFNVELICGDPQVEHRREAISEKAKTSLSMRSRKRPKDFHQPPINR